MNKAILVSALLAVIMGTCSAQAADKKIIYLGDDRYTCRGNGCDAFIARENHHQRQREYQKRETERYNEDRELRQRERDSYERSYRSSRFRDDE